MALAGVAGILVVIVAVSVISRYQIGLATPGSATPMIGARSPVSTPTPMIGARPPVTTLTPTGAAPVESLPTIGPAFPETLPVVYTGQNLRMLGWSPDGSLFAVMESPQLGSRVQSPSILIFDRSGARVGAEEGEYFAWIDSSQYVVLRFTLSDPTAGTGFDYAYLGEVGSTALTQLPGEYGGLLNGPSGAVALVLPWDGTVASPPQYVVISSGVPSQPRSGYPVAWSRDGNTLAVIHPDEDTPFGFGGPAFGWLDVVRPTGQRIVAARNVEIGLLTPAATFSPDGALVAFLDYTNVATGGQQIGVLDVGSGLLTRTDNFGAFSWSGDDHLMCADRTSGHILSWSVGNQPFTYGAGTIVGASRDGLVVAGTEDASELSVTSTSDGTWGELGTLTLGGWPVGGIPDAAWSPDGRSLVLISGEPGLTYEDAVLARF